MMRVFVNLIFILLSGGYGSCFASDYYSQHAVGWHWYDDPKEKEETKVPAIKPEQKNPNVVVAVAKKRITTALNKVIAEPTLDNMKQYIALQEQLGDRAEKISDLWAQVLLQNPELNYSITHPTNNVALQVYHEQASQEKEVAVTQFAKANDLFFFYRSTCPYCERFAPILKKFAEKYHINVVPITLDGISLPEFPNSPRDSGEAAQFQVTVTPSLIAVNHLTQKAFPVAYGVPSETELRENIYKIVTQYEGSK